MRVGCWAFALSAVACLQAQTASAQVTTLTLADVQGRARERSPVVVAAHLAIEEARGRSLDARSRFQTNPDVDVEIGRRGGEFGGSTDFAIAVEQHLEPGARRAARLDEAMAGVASGSAEAGEVVRLTVRSATAAYYRALHAAEEVRVLRLARELAADTASIAARRFAAGDIAVLDVNVARGTLARASARVEGAEAMRVLALADLQQELGLEGEIDVTGSLTPPARATELQPLVDSVAQRPEIAALQSAIDAAEADERLAQSFTRPAFGVGASFAREEGDRIVMGGLTITLPVFVKGQGLSATSAARATRLRVELESARTRIQIEVRAAYTAYERRLAALRILETDALPGLDENEALSARSYEVGQIGLPDLLLIRRETLDTRMEYLDTLLEAALARVDLDASVGVMP